MEKEIFLYLNPVKSNVKLRKIKNGELVSSLTTEQLRTLPKIGNIQLTKVRAKLKAELKNNKFEISYINPFSNTECIAIVTNKVWK